MEKRNIKLIVEYDGTDFWGYQIQPHGRTVQGELQKVLSKITNRPVKLNVAGRTDTGVHAMGQVVNFMTDSCIALEKLLSGLNALLPPDISISQVQKVPSSFHARFSAIARTYVYSIDVQKHRSPFRFRYFYHVPFPVDHELMIAAAKTLIGERDFSSYRASSDSNKHAFRRMIDAGGWKDGSSIYFYFQANAFLHHMIRNIMGTLLLVGRGKISLDEFCAITEARDRTKAGPTASPSGLCLMKVTYPEIFVQK